MRTITQVAASLLGAGFVAAWGSSLTDVKNPAIVQPAAEENATGAIARYAGAVRSATSALNSGIQQGGVYTDELILTDFPGNSVVTRWDARRPQNLVWQTGSIFTTYQGARVGVGRALIRREDG